jgi:hypothetical protein|nr:hypothetical protein [Neorhizobium tomejilense]
MPWYGNTKIEENTIEEAAEAYFEVLGSTPNAWGRHLHPVYGDSRNMLSMMQGVFGSEAFNTAFEDICRERREAKVAQPPVPCGPRI